MSDAQKPPSARLGDHCGRGELPQLLTKAEVKRLSEVDGLRFSGAALIEVASVAGAIFLSVWTGNLFVYLLAVVVIGSRINAFGGLMHDATHYRAYKTRWLNEIVGELLALPTTTSMAGYRNNHFAHHRALNGANDPDWNRNADREEYTFPITRAGLTRRVAEYLFGLNLVPAVTGYHSNKETRDVPGLVSGLRVFFFVTLFALSFVFGYWKWLLLYWAVPLLTVFLAIRYFRNVAEHYAVEHENVLNESRTVIAPFWERWLIAPWGLNYHLEHHLYPSVPCFRLHELHNLLMTREPFLQNAHVTDGYLNGLFRDCAVFPEPAYATADTHPVAVNPEQAQGVGPAHG
jgi:fatty acid desaturase